MNSTGIEPSTLLQAHDPPAMTPRVRTSLVYCRQLTRQRAGNFYYGLMLTPEPKRSAVYAVYAFMRRCDDLADGPQAGAAEDVRARIETFRAQMEQVLAAGPDAPLPQDPIWPAFWYVARTYPLDRAHLHAMLDGQLCDLLQTRYACFDELEAYCYRVASVVGLVCLSIWGYQGGQATQELARERGIAFQLTNILRDLAEDAQRGRIYLPRDEMERFGYSEADLLAGRADESFDRLMAFQVERARGYYERSAALEERLSADCCATSWAMTRIYRGLLERIARQPRVVLQKRVRLGSVRKLSIAAQALWRRGRPG